MADGKFVWNVFFKGPEGFKEHIQATAEDGEALAGARAAVLGTLKTIGASPEADGPRGQRGYSNRPASGGPAPDPMVAAAAATGVAKVCAVHNVAMVYKPAGFSQTKKDASGNPKPYSASYRCPERNCTSIEWMS